MISLIISLFSKSLSYPSITILVNTTFQVFMFFVRFQLFLIKLPVRPIGDSHNRSKEALQSIQIPTRKESRAPCYPEDTLILKLRPGVIVSLMVVELPQIRHLSNSPDGTISMLIIEIGSLVYTDYLAILLVTVTSQDVTPVFYRFHHECCSSLPITMNFIWLTYSNLKHNLRVPSDTYFEACAIYLDFPLNCLETP